jgi:integrase
MTGTIRENEGKKKSTFYVVIPWDSMDGTGETKKWTLKHDKRGDRFDSRAHAKRFLEFLRTLIDEGTFNPCDWSEAKPHSLEGLKPEYLRHYQDKVERGEISPSTLAVKKRYFAKYFEPYFAGQDLKYIGNLNVTKFHNQLPRLKAKSRSNVMSELNTFFEWARAQGVIKTVPKFTEMANLKRLAKEQRPPVMEHTHMMPEENFKRALAEMEPGDRPIFRFYRLTGCRNSEGRAMQRPDFHWQARVFEIRRTWVDSDQGEVLVERPKSGSMRDLAITDEIEAVVKSVPPRLDIPFVFWNPKTGTAYTRREIDYRWRTALKKAGIPHMSLKNATRANMICEGLKLGYSFEQCGRVAGHEHVSTTMFYGSIFVDQTAGILERKTRGAGTKTEPKRNQKRNSQNETIEIT